MSEGGREGVSEGGREGVNEGGRERGRESLMNRREESCRLTFSLFLWLSLSSCSLARCLRALSFSSWEKLSAGTTEPDTA